MKKLIAISVMLALIAGAVFAETQVSGAVETRLNLYSSKGADKEKAKESVSLGEANIQLSGANDEGTMGATLRIKPQFGTDKYDFSIANAIHKAFVWWKPIDQLQIFLGQDPDGKFGTDNLTGWGFFASGTDYLNKHDWGFWRNAYPGNWDTFGLAISIYPVDGLEFDVVVPYIDKSEADQTVTGDDNLAYKAKRIEDIFVEALQISASYNISDIGKASFTYRGPKFDAAPTPSTSYPDTADKPKTASKGLVGFNFEITAVEGFKIQPGFSVDLQDKDNGGSKYNPTYISLAVVYSADALTAKLRSSYVLNDSGNDKNSQFIIHVLPSYQITDALLAYAEIDINSKKVGDKTTTGWGVFPGVKVGLGAGSVGLGLKIQNSGATNAKTSIDVPVKFGFSF